MAWGRKSKPETTVAGVPQADPASQAALDPSVEIELDEEEAAGNPGYTYIGDGMEIKGSVSTASSLAVAGFIEGDVNSAGNVQVYADAVIQGSVSAQGVTVAGTIEGNVTASGRLHIGKTGKVTGDVEVKALQVEEGGALLGRCKMTGGA
jgi:cytoskeletal protein CcmA (bactofilin family)